MEHNNNINALSDLEDLFDTYVSMTKKQANTSTSSTSDMISFFNKNATKESKKVSEIDDAPTSLPSPATKQRR